MRDPKGRKSVGFDKHVFVCENKRDSGHPRECCYNKSKENIKTLFKKELENYARKNIRVNSAGCLDFCEQGPTIVIYPEGVWYSVVNPEKDIPEIVKEHLINAPTKVSKCSFERIYFSRGSDKDIYNERKELGRLIVEPVLETVDHDLDNTVFSFIPNTAEISFYGMVKGLESYLNVQKIEEVQKLGSNANKEDLEKIINRRARIEKIAIKDAKLRTFITQDDSRNDLVSHVYDITYGGIRAHEDNLVVIDDSIVRGTTLRQSIFKILDRMNPKKIVVVSSAPQIRYPDCYGIDMAKLGDFIAFNAAISLLREQGKESIIDEVYQLCLSQVDKPKEEVINHVKKIYDPFTPQEISKRIAELLTPEDMKAPVDIVYQSIENLHQACPNNKGDWYFTGNYPTPGGNKVVNKAFINWKENRNERAY